MTMGKPARGFANVRVVWFGLLGALVLSGFLFALRMRKPRTPDASASLAMILLKTPSLPNEEQLRPAVDANRGVAVDEVRGTDAWLVVDGSRVFVSLMPTPIPWSQIEGPCATAWWWPDATEVCRSSVAHAIVFLKDDGIDVFERNLRLTRATAFLLQSTPDALGVYWGAGTLVQPRDGFIEQARLASRESLPLHLWVDFRVERRSDGARFYATTGMKALGLMELECVSRRQNPIEVIGLLFNIAHYLCDNGLVLKDGDTIGISASDKNRIRHRRSAWDREPVLFVEID